MTVNASGTTDRELQSAVRNRRLIEVATLDYRRSIKHLEHELRQADIARALGVTQPALSSALKTARSVPDPVPGFSGAGPYEICQRYAVGQLGREQAIEELTRWEYPPVPEPDWLEDVVEPAPAGSWEEMEDALDDGLIDDEMYEVVLRGRSRIGREGSPAA